MALLAAAAKALVLEQADVLFEERDAFGLFGDLFELLRVLVELAKRQCS